MADPATVMKWSGWQTFGLHFALKRPGKQVCVCWFFYSKSIKCVSQVCSCNNRLPTATSRRSTSTTPFYWHFVMSLSSSSSSLL